MKTPTDAALWKEIKGGTPKNESNFYPIFPSQLSLCRPLRSPQAILSVHLSPGKIPRNNQATNAITQFPSYMNKKMYILLCSNIHSTFSP